MIRFPSFGADDAADADSNASAAGAAGKQAAAHPLDALTGGVFSAETSGERAARVRAWLATEPDVSSMQAVFKELSARDKGAAKALREKLDDIKRSKGQEALVAEWAAKAEALLQASRFNIADGMAWQRDAAKAGAPLSREPLAGFKQQLAERIKGIEDLQTRAQVQREAAVLLAQRIEILSAKSWKEADAAQTSLQADVQHWHAQAEALKADGGWGGVDAKYAAQVDSAAQQLQLVAQAFEEALAQTRVAVADASRPLPPVPVWADELRALRGEAPPAEAVAVSADPAEQAKAAEKAAAQAQRRAEAQAAVQAAVQTLEQELAGGHSKAGVAAAQALRQMLKEHRKLAGAELEGKAHTALASAGELEGWQRWRADQIRQELVQQAEALIERPARAALPQAETAAPEGAAAGAATETAAPEEATAEAADVTAPAATDAAPEAHPEQLAAQDTPVPEAETTPATPASVAEAEESTATAQGTEEPVAEAEAAPQPGTAAEVAAEAAAPESESGKPAAMRPMPRSKLSPRKLQETLRHLREQWKETDQGGVPNHALWKRFDSACNEAYRIVEAWLATMKEQAAGHKAARLGLLEDVQRWGEQLASQAQANAADWKAAHRELHAFAKRWREAGHLSEKIFADLQPRWKAALAQASAPLEAVQKASVQLRQAMIDEAAGLGAAANLRLDAVKALQQRWQQEAQTVPLERRQEQKLWDAFRKPIDEAFQRKSQQREQTHATLSARDQAVVQAARALEAANASGDGQAIQAAMRALDAAMKAPHDAAALPGSVPADGVDAAEKAESADAASSPDAATDAPAPALAAEGEEGAPRPPSASALAHRPAIAVRGDDRPQARAADGKAQAYERRDGRPGRGDARGRPGERGRDDRRDFAPRAPRLGDAAFRAQRDAVEHAQTALRKLAAQAQGEILTHLMHAWEQRQPEAVPSASDLGKGISGSQRNTWVAALGALPQQQDAETALLRLEMAADAPTPAEHLSARRALQLQLLTRRNDPAPAETWVADAAAVLGSNYDAQQARRMQNVLRVLLRGR